MKYKEFLTCIENKVKESTEDGCKVAINHVIKNNGCELDGLVIMHEGQFIAPTIYINDYYHQYLSGKDIDDVVSDIMTRYNEGLDNMCFDEDDIGDFSKYESIRDKVVYRLVNYEKNKKLLEDVPHIKIMDLAVIYYCYYGTKNGTSGYALIKNSNIAMWGINNETLHKDAVNNTPVLLESVILGMGEVLRKMMEGMMTYEECKDDARQIKEFLEDYDAMYEDEMYVLTNKTMLNGASTMMYYGVLDSIADKIGYDLYILPSSIHELILVPVKSSYKASELKKMVCQVNNDEVSDNEILSDSVYCYSRKDKQIHLVS